MKEALIASNKEVWWSRREALPIGQADSFDGVVAVVHFVAGFKHNAKPPTAKALHWLKVCQVPGERHFGYYSAKRNHWALSSLKKPCVAVTELLFQISDNLKRPRRRPIKL